MLKDIIEESEDDSRYDDISDSQPPIALPACELGKLDEISELVSSCLSSPIRREKLAVAIQNENYIKKLLELFHMCEGKRPGWHFLLVFWNILIDINLKRY